MHSNIGQFKGLKRVSQHVVNMGVVMFTMDIVTAEKQCT